MLMWIVLTQVKNSERPDLMGTWYLFWVLIGLKVFSALCITLCALKIKDPVQF